MDAVSDLCSRHEVAVFGYFLRRTASPELAWELTDETWAAARLAARRVKPAAGPAEAWIFAIARETLCDSLRAGRVRDRARTKSGPGPIDDRPRDVAGASDQRLAEFAAALPPALGEAITARVPARDAAALASRLRARDEADVRRARRSVRRAPLLGRLRLAGR